MSTSVPFVPTVVVRVETARAFRPEVAAVIAAVQFLAPAISFALIAIPHVMPPSRRFLANRSPRLQVN
jgi:hypothetical protein